MKDVVTHMGVASMTMEYGVYAFRINGAHGPADILATDCSELIVAPSGIWYKINNSRNIIHEVERWVFIPYHGILAIAYNNKLKVQQK